LVYVQRPSIGAAGDSNRVTMETKQNDNLLDAAGMPVLVCYR